MTRFPNRIGSCPNRFIQGFATLSFRAKRRICFFFALAFVFTTASASAQTPARPKITGIGRVTIVVTTDATGNPFMFYNCLKLKEIGGFSTGGQTQMHMGVNDRQELDLIVPTHALPTPKDPLSNNLVQVLFETSDIVALQEYLKSQKIQVSEVIADDRKTIVDGKLIGGDSSVITMQDPDGHHIGFMQYKTSLELTKQQGQVSSHLIHAGFIVRNREAMDHFYKDVLGFRPYWHGGMKDDETSWVSLQVPDGTDWLEFMLYDTAGKDKHFLGVMNHIALGVTDIQAAKVQLIKNGLTLPEEPKLGRDGKWQLNVFDPDDTRIEFMEFLPKEKPCCSEFAGPHPGSNAEPSVPSKP
jgi:catechol 2,3-dioxygenase-like lactoylglutathione lyase family enzyme